MICFYCKKELKDNDKFCPYCGIRVSASQQNDITNTTNIHTEETQELKTSEIPNNIITKKNIIVSTGDLKQDYEIIGPVYFQTSNKGIFSSALSTLVKKYHNELEQMKTSGQLTDVRLDWGFLYGEWSVGQNDFDRAFFVSVQELRARAAMLGADAIICMRQDIDLDTNGFTYFYLQIYGTAVKFK